MTISPLAHRFCAAVLAFCVATSSVGQTVELSLDEGRSAARNAVLAGNFALARDFALALVQANPDDRDALIVLAAAYPQLGEAREGRAAGVRAYRLSDEGPERYEAARLTALAAANEERYTLSQIWLRRAAVHAPNDRAFAQTQRDYRGIRNLNPWSVNLGLSVTPSNNVNGGSETEYNIIDGVPIVGVLSGDAQALPGVSAKADVRLSYDLSRSTDHTTTLGARAYARAVWLSDEARTIAPDNENGDFASQVLELSANHQRRVGDGTLSAGGTLGASWFGGELSQGYLRGRLGYSLPTSERSRLSVMGEVEQSYDPSPWTPSTASQALSATYAHQLESGNRVSARLGYETQSSDNLNERFESLTAQVTYTWKDPLGPVGLSASAGVAVTHFPDYTIIFPVPDGRQDTRVFGSMTATFADLDYAGFVPVMTLGVQDTQSNVSRFQRNEYSLSVGVRSSF